jgi:hypothetical protein
MPSLWFDTPQTTVPLTTEPLSFTVRVCVDLEHFFPDIPPAVQLVVTPTPASITPPNGVAFVRAGTSCVIFTVTFNDTTDPFQVTLNANLYQDGNIMGPVTASASAVTVTVNPNGSPFQAPFPSQVQATDAGNTAHAAGAAADADTTDATPALAAPIFLTGSTLVDAVSLEDAASVVCVVYQTPLGVFTVDGVNAAMILPKHGYVVALDPVYRLGLRSYRLYWVDELGNTLMIQSNPLG